MFGCYLAACCGLALALLLGSGGCLVVGWDMAFTQCVEISVCILGSRVWQAVVRVCSAFVRRLEEVGGTRNLD